MFDHVHGHTASHEQFSKNSPSMDQLTPPPLAWRLALLSYHVARTTASVRALPAGCSVPQSRSRVLSAAQTSALPWPGPSQDVSSTSNPTSGNHWYAERR